QLAREKKLIEVLVEPFYDNIKSARLNFQAQQIGNVFFEESGLYNKNCFLQIEKNFRDAREWSIQIKETDKDTGLKAVQIIDLLNKYGINEVDILKLDIEGAEKYLFFDANYAAEFLKRTRIIAIEIHKEYIEESSILHVLKDNNFTVYKSGEIHIGVKEN
ncbi:MAG TPA: FkbM family methyltransferase, partial [Puia sp.]|nr:FkbM family methyltransferase [Puia sp.]